VQGRLEMYPLDKAEKKTRASQENITRISGGLLLDAAQISHVILSGDSFPPDPPREIPVRVALERATIGRLQVMEPLRGTLELSNLKVDRWDWPSEIQDMLRRSQPFKKSNYMAIENALRNAGDDEKADKVYLAMRRRDRSTTQSRLKRIPGWFLDWSIGYGTKSLRLVGFMLVWFGVSLWSFSHTNCVKYKTVRIEGLAKQVPGETSTNTKQVQYEIVPVAETPPSLSPPPHKWRIWDAALFSLRLHVPIVALGVREDVEPSGTWMEFYSLTIIAISWVMWPLLIASASGFIKRRR
ncbi:MAG TPA: hypothetical protein VN345_01530, partial [Blastocatellia bacterium]|nr:hypothetical protein [Blastocatellia bacterium]